MEKFIPYEKLSKKEKRKIDQARRQTWGELNPVTRKPENSKAYNRNKARNWKRETWYAPHRADTRNDKKFECLLYGEQFISRTNSGTFIMF